jgi:acyl carrier protein
MDPRDLTKIRAFVGKLLRDHDDHAGFADTESLVNSGRLDSLAVVKLLEFLESAFGVDFAEIEFDPQRFDTVDEIAALIEESGAPGALRPAMPS